MRSWEVSFQLTGSRPPSCMTVKVTGTHVPVSHAAVKMLKLSLSRGEEVSSYTSSFQYTFSGAEARIHPKQQNYRPSAEAMQSRHVALFT